jgi:hypothetical protein
MKPDEPTTNKIMIISIVPPITNSFYTEMDFPAKTYVAAS